MINETPTINIKGIRDGLLVIVDAAAGPEWPAALAETVAERAAFLKGSRLTLDLGDRPVAEGMLRDVQLRLTRQELELWAVLSTHAPTREAARALGLATRLTGSLTDLDGNALAQTAAAGSEAVVPAGGPEPEDSAPLPNGVVLHETLRSGRSLYHEGHVIVIGDVNPGAEIIAGGNVVVWGKLRGLVHAGAMGALDAVVCALELAPTQLRIADQITVTPATRRRQSVPEVARIQDGQIVAEAWPRDRTALFGG